MAFIDTVDEADATGPVKAMYDQMRATFGYLPNMTRVFSHRPEVNAAWVQLLTRVRGASLDARRYELATMAAARALGSSYCMLAHGSVLLNGIYDAGQVRAIAEDYRDAGLDAADVAMMAFAEKIARDATSVSASDIAGLRENGFSDPEIFDIAATAAARCFFGKLLDALGAEPDMQYGELDDDLQRVLTVGRPISQSP